MAAVAVSMSDGSAFSGTLAASPAGTVTISGKNLVLARALTSADNGPHQWGVAATQNGVTVSGSIPVQVNAASAPPPPPPPPSPPAPPPPPPGRPSFTVNGSVTPAPAVTGSNIIVAVMNDPGGDFVRILDPNGSEIQRSGSTPAGASQFTLPLTEQINSSNSRLCRPAYIRLNMIRAALTFRYPYSK